jgi:hypothetical protein
MWGVWEDGPFNRLVGAQPSKPPGMRGPAHECLEHRVLERLRDELQGEQRPRGTLAPAANRLDS